MSNIILGVDISKKTFDVALLRDNKIKTKKFNNETKGFVALLKWLASKEVTDLHICMEATGSYGAKLAEYLYENNFKVSVENPARIKGFAMSQLSRVKTDKADSKLIARFCEAMKPNLWHPKPAHIQELQQWVRRLDTLISNKNQEHNRLNVSEQSLVTHIQRHIDFIEKEIKEVEGIIVEHIKLHKDLQNNSNLLTSIPGIGERTVSIILSACDVKDFDSVKQVVAFFGLNPKQRQSGSSLNGASRISKIGRSELRKALYMPALSAIRCNPIIKEFAERLESAGKSKMVIIIASMRKLLHIIYGVLKHQNPFNENIKTI